MDRRHKEISPLEEPGKVICPCGSGKTFSDCHGTNPLAGRPATEPPPLKLVEATSTSLLKLDLACGQSPKDGFTGIDLHYSGAAQRVDLWKFPWPWADNSVEEIHCSHHVEHIPAREVEESDLSGDGAIGEGKRYIGEDMFFAFFDECYRILRPEGWITIVTPCARNNRAFQDPTHRRFIVMETFYYLNEEFRKVNKLDHYKVRCNFAPDINFTHDTVVNARADEVKAEMLNHRWNYIVDFYAKLKSLKPAK